MFANLKNKIFEEVKASPQKFQQFAQAAQAAVSSASSNASDSVSGSDNFFSITEEDTPQNSPLKIPSPASKTSTQTSSINQSPAVSFANNGVMINRTRRLSNSSMASDVSFRLPSYESPAVYHLQSDLDISASEVEDSVGGPSNVHLEVISKEQLHSAYKKALERYQKYRSRFTDLAKRYRDLERDSTKARSVLVETQDKAIRRISELREQCSLEQQAKAHLEEALRLEMDDMQCKIDAYQTKLKLMGENPDNLSNSNDKKSNDEESLIQLDTEEDRVVASNTNKENIDPPLESDNASVLLFNEKIMKLEELVSKFQQQLKDNSFKLEEKTKENDSLKNKFQQSEALIASLKKIEEENSILLAENKLMVHTELENKESEVKQLKQKLIELEKTNSHDQLIAELRNQLTENEKSLSNAQKLFADSEEKFNKIEKENKDLKLIEARKSELEKELENIAKQLSELQILLDARKDIEEKVKTENDKLKLQVTELEKELKESKIHTKTCKNEIKELKAEIDSNRIIYQSQESLAINSLQETLNESNSKHEAHIRSLETDLSQKDSECKGLQKKLIELTETVNASRTNMEAKTSEESILTEECRILKGKIEIIQNERAEREIQMEKEKIELKSQVTNILQEIGRMEEQMKEVRKSHAELEEEKRALEKKIEKMTKQNQANQEGNQKWQVLIQESEDKIKQLEIKLQSVESENSVLAEKNCLQQENLNRFEMQLKENENNLKKEKASLNSIIKEAEVNYSAIRLEHETANETIRKLNEKMSQVLDENSRLHNAKEIMEHEFRSLQDQCESREKEKLCVLDSNKCLEEQLNSLREEHTQLQEQNSNRPEQEKLDELVIEVRTLKENKAGLEKEINQLKEKITTLNLKEEEIAKVQADNTKLKGEIEKLSEECNNLRTELQEAKNKEDELTFNFNSKLSGISQENISLKEQNDFFSKEINVLNTQNQTRLTELENLLKRTNDEKQTLKESIKNATDLEKKLQNYEEQKIENEYLNTLTHQLEGDIRKLMEEKSKSESEIKDLKEKVKSQQCELYVCSENKVKHETELNEIDVKLQEANSEIQRLSETIGSEREESKRQIEHSVFITNQNDSLQKELLSWQQKLSAAELLCGETRSSFEQIHNENEQLKKNIETAQENFSSTYDHLSIENEQNKNSIVVLTDQLNNANQQLEKLETFELENQQLHCKLKELETELSEKAKIKTETAVESSKLQQTEMEILRKINETLQRELEDLKHKTSAHISNLTHEIDDLTSNANHMSEKITEYEQLKDKHKKLTADMTDLQDANANENADMLESMRQEKEDLELKLEKIMHEVQDVSNRNLFLEQKCENYLILEQSNERLKLANEKLSRQLDETLVSMQHNEGISANTEFEYLKNIMFQYLTGHVTGNNSTLIKVIAAVLKFSPQQTQVAIEKENQRHTLIGQINNLL